MQEFVSINGRILSPAEAVIHAVSSATLYGKGVFTTVAVYDGQPFLWGKHWRRLKDDAEKLGIDISRVSEAAIFRSLEELGERNALKYGRARVTIFDGSSPEIWPFETGRETSVLITTAEFRERPEKFRLTVSPYRINSRSPLAGVKSCNYLENLLSLNEARDRGFHEGVRLNERGEVASACMANIFWERDGRLYTPSLQTGCLRGTMRDLILSSLPCSEAEFGADDLATADSIFLASTGIGVVRVSSLDGRIFPETEHQILGLLPRSA